nr:unnamed protein product [Digitaria exilis]
MWRRRRRHSEGRNGVMDADAKMLAFSSEKELIGNVEQHLANANATSTTLLHQMRDLWKSHRGTVLRIEALALVAIILSFFLAFFGSCRRWSNRWVAQKGFLAAHVLSLSLGTYSIGLMQSSSVKSEMYPIWAVSLLALSGCIDQVISYNGFDYKGPLAKMIFQLCLYCGYVLLMSFSTISVVFGNLAISMLCAITFIKGFHRSLALVLPSRLQDELGYLEAMESGALAGNNGEELRVYLTTYFTDKAHKDRKQIYGIASMANVYSSSNDMLRELPFEITAKDKTTIEDVCLGYSLSHLLRRRFLGINNVGEMKAKRMVFESSVLQDSRAFDYKRMLKAIEIELAFLYEVFFTSNEYLHFYQAKGASIWALASFIGICLVGVATAIPGKMASRHRNGPPNASTVVVEATTTADLIITLAILVSLALLQLVQLIRCWTSNWARVAFACNYLLKQQYLNANIIRPTATGWRPWMRLKAFVVTRVNWFDNDTSKPTVALHDDVKTSVADFLGQIKSGRIDKQWSSLFVDNGVDASFLPYTRNNGAWGPDMFTRCVLAWHIATCYCEVVADHEAGSGEMHKHRRVAIALSRYCIYLMASAPELLLGPATQTTDIFRQTARRIRYVEAKDWLNSIGSNVLIHAMERKQAMRRTTTEFEDLAPIVMGMYFGKLLIGKEIPPPPGCTRRRSDDPWKLVALLWVQTLLYAAPYGDVEVHRQRLSQGGEFITHLWALLYHLGIDS